MSSRDKTERKGRAAVVTVWSSSMSGRKGHTSGDGCTWILARNTLLSLFWQIGLRGFTSSRKNCISNQEEDDTTAAKCFVASNTSPTSSIRTVVDLKSFPGPDGNYNPHSEFLVCPVVSSQLDLPGNLPVPVAPATLQRKPSTLARDHGRSRATHRFLLHPPLTARNDFTRGSSSPPTSRERVPAENHDLRIGGDDSHAVCFTIGHKPFYSVTPDPLKDLILIASDRVRES
ncbi:unnamed protein product [Pleuronectes platessa]|uniref:Uncharacterized protein n=1 Tax=Pleuronectes platessa TaxID=8262 RepID=A0A9N7YNR1_PLEPL|nr:unnamed protein product [Pleuronectes platessa]